MKLPKSLANKKNIKIIKIAPKLAIARALGAY